MTKKNSVVRKPRPRASSQKSSGLLPPSVERKISVSAKQSAPQSAPNGVRSVSTVKWVGTGQIALKSGLSLQTIRNDIERGKIIAHKTGAGRYVISREEAERYLLENGYAAVSFN